MGVLKIDPSLLSLCSVVEEVPDLMSSTADLLAMVNVCSHVLVTI